PRLRSALSVALLHVRFGRAMRDVRRGRVLGGHRACRIRAQRTAAESNYRRPRRESDARFALSYGICCRAAAGRSGRSASRGGGCCAPHRCVGPVEGLTATGGMPERACEAYGLLVSIASPPTPQCEAAPTGSPPW